MTTIIYTSKGCVECLRLKQEMGDRGEPFEERGIAVDRNRYELLMLNRINVPTVVRDGAVVTGIRGGTNFTAFTDNDKGKEKEKRK